MRAQTVDQLNESAKSNFSISKISDEMKTEFKILTSIAFRSFSEVLNLKFKNLLGPNKKIDYKKLFGILKMTTHGSNYPWNRDYKETINFTLGVAPMIGLIKWLPDLSKEEKAEMKNLEKLYTSDFNPADFSNAEIDERSVTSDDYWVRHIGNDTDISDDEGAYYRFEDKDGKPRKLNQQESNFLRLIYTQDHGTMDPGFKNSNAYYMYVSVIKYKNAEKWNRLPGKAGFKGQSYN